MTGRLQGQIAIITGSASGIGRATAEVFAEQGADVVLADINEADLKDTAALVGKHGREALVVPTNVGVAEAIQTLVSSTMDRFGRIDALVNVAGVQRSSYIEDYDDDVWDLMMLINPRSCYLTAKHIVPIMKKQGGGRIINVASNAALNGGPGQSGYAASKGAIVSFTRSLANEVAPAGIRVNSISPGWIDTPFNAPAIAMMGGRDKQDALVDRNVPMRRQGEPREVAEVALFLASDAASFMSGQNLVPSGGE